MRKPNKTIGRTFEQVRVLHRRDYPELFMFIRHQGNAHLSTRNAMYIPNMKTPKCGSD